MDTENFILYVRLYNIETEDGIVPGGMVIDFGQIRRQTTLSYEEIIKVIDKAEFLNYMRLDEIFKPENIEFVTKEEYEKVFPDEDIDEQGGNN